MNKCDSCGNNYDKCFEVIIHSEKFTFDCFECAIHTLAPVCQNCHCKIIGHGIEEKAGFFCCSHCAKQE